MTPSLHQSPAFCRTISGLDPARDGRPPTCFEPVEIVSVSQPHPAAAAARPLSAFGSQVEPFLTGYLARWTPYKENWNYEDGCIFKGCLDLFHATGRTDLFRFVERAVSARIGTDGGIRGYDPDDFNIDNINPGKVLFPLFAATGDQRYRAAMDRQRAQLDRHPRTRSGNFWHKAIYPWQVWLDGLYMAQPFQVSYARLTGDAARLADVLAQFAVVRQVLRDPASGLYVHGWDERRAERWSDPQTGRSPHVWARAMGWFAMAIVDCLEPWPGERTDGLEPLADLLVEVAAALETVRSPAGLWWQVATHGGATGNYEESSASLMIAYALLKGARSGVLAPRYATLGRTAVQAVIDRHLTMDALGGICGVAGLGNTPYRDGSYDYYVSERVVANDPKGVGALFMALAEAVQGV